MKSIMTKVSPFCALSILCFAAATLSASEEAPQNASPIFKADSPSWQMDFTNAELLAVQEDRRKKPLQTYAFETIEQMVGRPLFGSTFLKVPTGETGEAGDKDNPKVVKMGAMDLYLSIWFFPEYWFDKPLILVSNHEIRKLLTPPPAVVSADAGAYAGVNREVYYDPDNKRFSLRDIYRSPLVAMTKELEKKPEDKQTTVDKEMTLVFKRVQLFTKIAMSERELAMIPHPDSTQGPWPSLLDIYQGEKKDTHVIVDMSVKGFPGQKLSYDLEGTRKTIEAYFAFKNAYKARDAAKFAEASLAFRESLRSLSSEIYPADARLKVETQYNNARPFAWAWMFYLFAALVTLAALKVKSPPLYIAAFLLYLTGLGLHVYGFALRCYIAGRPPVSNMYESVIWVGFGAVFFGLIFELIYRKRFYMLAGSFAGFLCLVLMDLVPVMVGDSKTPGFAASIEPLQPVLRDNFWLTVHVLTITLSYAAFMLAWGMGHITMMSHLTRPTERTEHRELHNLVYRVIQIGVLLLSIGTILGGVWAYYSWGRFWGWDPKETWAFIALMCYIVVLHGRFAGLWTNFGLAFGSIFCFQAIVMAWYGVNFVLGSGKHSYGSGGGGKEVVLTCVGLDMLFLAAATFQYLRHKNLNAKAASDDNDDDEDQSARGRVNDLPGPTKAEQAIVEKEDVLK